jgi:hypothetical protein
VRSYAAHSLMFLCSLANALGRRHVFRRGQMRRFLPLVMALAALSCTISSVCTLIGCNSGLTVQIQNAPTGPLSVVAVDVQSPASQYTASCPGDTGCTNQVFFRDFTPGSVNLMVTTTAGTRQITVAPTYETSRPNGPNCAPTCRSATIVFTWQ